LKASAGLNLALDYLPGSVMYDPLVEKLDPALASMVVWFDAYITNVDRTPRNANMLIWHKKLWLIDHGAALYFHHAWTNYMERSRQAFELIKEHVLLPSATLLREADEELPPRLTEEVIGDIVGLIPDVWLDTDTQFEGPDEARRAYKSYLSRRLEAPRLFLEEAERARASLI
jgi:hypothetical protein